MTLGCSEAQTPCRAVFLAHRCPVSYLYLTSTKPSPGCLPLFPRPTLASASFKKVQVYTLPVFPRHCRRLVPISGPWCPHRWSVTLGLASRKKKLCSEPYRKALTSALQQKQAKLKVTQSTDEVSSSFPAKSAHLPAQGQGITAMMDMFVSLKTCVEILTLAVMTCSS